MSTTGDVALTYGWDWILPSDTTWTGPIADTVHEAYGNDFRLASRTIDGGAEWLPPRSVAAALVLTGPVGIEAAGDVPEARVAAAEARRAPAATGQLQ